MKKDFNRREINLNKSRVSEVLPSYFEQDNPNLLTFLDKYYDYLDSDGQSAFSSSIYDIIVNRDTTETSSELLNELIKEIGNGLQSASFFHQPRLMAKLLGAFYRSKGTLVSAEGFFKGFFNQEATIEYPKDQIFIVGESNVGFEGQKFIQNNTIYQIFSILIRTGISTRDYEALYKKFVHPAGWHFRGEVLLPNQVTVGVGQVFSGDSVRPPELIFATPVHSEAPIAPLFQFNEVTALVDSSNNIPHRLSLASTISTYQALTSTQLENFYTSLAQLLTPNSFTFDDSGSGFIYNGYPGKNRNWPSPNKPTNFVPDSAGHENQWFLANTFAPYNDLNTLVTAFGDDISVSWNKNLDATNATAAAASALMGTPTSKSLFTYDPNHVNFDSNNFVNPKHLHGFGAFNSGSNRSEKLPGLLIKGSILSPATPEFYYRIDSDAYYIGTPGVAAGTYSSNIGMRFAISKLRYASKDSASPDMSMDLETMDNDMFTRYTSDSSF